MRSLHVLDLTEPDPDDGDNLVTLNLRGLIQLRKAIRAHLKKSGLTV